MALQDKIWCCEETVSEISQRPLGFKISSVSYLIWQLENYSLQIMTNILPTHILLLFVLVLILFMLLTKKFNIVIWWLFSNSQEKNYSLTEHFSKYFLKMAMFELLYWMPLVIKMWIKLDVWPQDIGELRHYNLASVTENLLKCSERWKLMWVLLSVRKGFVKEVEYELWWLVRC